jgi:Uma2 family endonuclease
MAATSTLPPETLVSIEDYLQTFPRPDVDFVDGHIEHRRPPEGNYTQKEMETLFLGEYEHNKLQQLLSIWFFNHAVEWNIDSVPEQRTRVSPTRIRICDFSVLRGDAPFEKVTLTPPLICIEILSPRDRITRAKVVLEDYRRMGVPNIWLIDPIKHLVWTYDSDGLHEVPATSLEVPSTPIYLPVADLLGKIR